MYDYVVIGSGIAGLFTALRAAAHGSVLIITKSALEESNTRYAQGGIAAAMAPNDSPQLHYEDTLVAGAGLCNQQAVRVLTAEAPQRIADLLSYEVPFDREGAVLALGREGAHRVARVLHAGGDATGLHIEHALAARLYDVGVAVREHTYVTQLLVEHGRVAGVVALTENGTPMRYAARNVVLASGGAGQLFRYTTNPSVATGDGIALALQAGAAIRDMEFVQFHPTALDLPDVPAFLVSEAVRGEGGVLRNSSGEPFMARYDPRADLASRDVVSRAIAAELTVGRGPVVLDVTHLPAYQIELRFPTILQVCMGYGLDMRRTPLPVAPAAHYLMGGVATDLWGATNLPGLYACGEVACSGVHGANRLASNSLLEGLVFGERIVRHSIGAAEPEPSLGLPTQRMAFLAPHSASWRGAEAQPPTRAALQQLMWEAVGLQRNELELAQAAKQLAAWQAALPQPHRREEYELAAMVLVGSLMALAALARTESRGSHFRNDFPVTQDKWLRQIEFVYENQLQRGEKL